MHTSRRVVVDAVDFSGFIRFHRILGAATAAMQPPRLVLGLLVIVLLLCFGNLWDTLREPSIHPRGLNVPWEAEDARNANLTLRAAINNHVPVDRRPPDWQTRNLSAETSETVALITESYREHRRAEEAKGTEIAELHRKDQSFIRDLESIDRRRPHGAFESATRHVVLSIQRIITGVGMLSAAEVFTGFRQLFLDLPVGLWSADRWFTIAFGLFFVVVTGLGGGALSRMAACDFAAREKLRVRDAIDFALSHWRSLVATPLLPIILAAALGGLILLLGVLMTVPVLDAVGGLLYGLALLLGLLLAFILLGYAAGFPLLLPAVACENCDAPDALTRAYAYLLARPLHLVGYLLTALLAATLGYLVVAGLAVITLNATAWLFGAITTASTANSAMTVAGDFELFDLTQRAPSRFHDSWHTATAAWFIGFWQTVIICLVGAYIVSCVFDAFTRTYLLMRRAADGQGTHEIWHEPHVPGTLIPRPKPTHTLVEAVIPSVAPPPPAPPSPGRAESIFSSLMRGVAAMRLGGRRRLHPVEPPSPESDQLGPELIPEQDRRVAGVGKDVL
jgi:hypothetical protein